MSTALTVADGGFGPVVSMVLDTVPSAHTKRAYARALNNFLTWWAQAGRPALAKRVVQSYVDSLREQGKSQATINQQLVAVRRLATEAADNELLAPWVADSIARVKGEKAEGDRTGVWLNREQAQSLRDAPTGNSVKAIRDRAILAVLLGTALRRDEAAHLTVEHLRQVEGRWTILNLYGKRKRVRTVPMPDWTKQAIDEWLTVAGVTSGPVFRGLRKGGHVQAEPVTGSGIRGVVAAYATPLGFAVAAHDLRRTWARLAYEGGAPLEQIQLSLGHASIKTTERYLGIRQSFTDAPCDRIGLR